ncbi:hypothetical protein ACWFR1_12210 [Streptomyces sp. NPDC055103]
MSQPTAAVGRIVHYVSHGTPLRSDGSQQFPPACRAAIVTEVDQEDTGRVGLAVFNPTGQFFHPLAVGGSVHADAAGMLGGSWHWPERV